MTTSDDELVDQVARAIDSDAFNITAHNSMADVNTRVGDFERGQERVRRIARRVIAIVRRNDNA